MGAEIGDEFSFALVIYVRSGESFRAFIWEDHSGQSKIGEVDPNTFEFLSEENGQVLIEKSESGDGLRTRFSFDFEKSAFPEGVEEFSFQSFHSLGDAENTRCDYAGPFVLG